MRKKFNAIFKDRKGKVLDEFETNSYSEIGDTFKSGDSKYIIESTNWDIKKPNQDSFIYNCRMLTENRFLPV